MTIIAIEMLGFAIFTAVAALVDVCRQDSDKAKESIGHSGACLLFSISFLLAGFISPIVNLIDLIGGGVASIVECCAEDASETSFDY